MRKTINLVASKILANRPLKVTLPPIHMIQQSTTPLHKLTYQYSTSSGKQPTKAPAAHLLLPKSNLVGSGFYMQQLFTGCLAIYSYYLESDKECFIIDPENDISQYVKLIEERGKSLKGVFVSHYHADYVSGQYQLAKKYGCKIYMGPKSIQTEQVQPLKDGEIIKFGQVKLQLIHTPGHTQESSCLLLTDSKGVPSSLFTGDTVFLNEVGRPDLAVKTNLTARDLAGMLFDSIQKVKKLDDNIRIYPGHGSGSSCGKSIGKGDFCTLGTQKQNNYALKAESKQAFVNKVLDEMPNPPAYFGYNANLNKFTPFSYSQIAAQVYTEFNPTTLSSLLKKQPDAIIVDVRPTKMLEQGIIKGAICVGSEGAFATWIGTLFQPTQKIIVYGPQGEAKENVGRLLRIGYINVLGYADFPIKNWKDTSAPAYVPQFVNKVALPNTTVLDVRNPAQWKTDGVVEHTSTLYIPLAQLQKNISQLNPQQNYVIHCRSGYRARLAYSLLRRKGLTNVKAYPSSFDSIFKSGEANKCPYKA